MFSSSATFAFIAFAVLVACAAAAPTGHSAPANDGPSWRARWTSRAGAVERELGLIYTWARSGSAQRPVALSTASEQGNVGQVVRDAAEWPNSEASTPPLRMRKEALLAALD